MKTSENIVTLIADFYCEQCTDSSQPNRDYTGEFMSLLRRLHDRVFPDYRFDQGQLLAQIQAQLRGNSRVVHGYYPPFGTQVILNGHEWVERQAQRQKVAVAKSGNCFVEGSDFAQVNRLAALLQRDSAISKLEVVCERWIYSSALCFALTREEQQRSGVQISVFGVPIGINPQPALCAGWYDGRGVSKTH